MATMYRNRVGPRAATQACQGQRVKDSPSLAARFPRLKSITLKFACHNSAGGRNGGDLKSVVNFKHAKSVFRFKYPTISQIRNSRAVYRLSTAEIIDLKESGVNNKAINYMINTASPYRP
jgi:hypothetical protein